MRITLAVTAARIKLAAVHNMERAVEGPGRLVLHIQKKSK